MESIRKKSSSSNVKLIFQKSILFINLKSQQKFTYEKTRKIKR